MKKASVITALGLILVAAFCLNCQAQDVAGKITALEKQSERVKAQIEQAKKGNQDQMTQQIVSINRSVQNLVRQRAQLDAQIARMEGQVAQFKRNKQARLDAQVKSYQQQLSQIKSHIGKLAAQKAVKTQKKVAKPAPQAPQASTSTPVQPAPAPVKKQ